MQYRLLRAITVIFSVGAIITMVMGFEVSTQEQLFLKCMGTCATLMVISFLLAFFEHKDPAYGRNTQKKS